MIEWMSVFHQNFEELFLKISQYLLIKEEKVDLG